MLIERYWTESLMNFLYAFTFESETPNINLIKTNLEAIVSPEIKEIVEKFCRENSMETIQTKDDAMKWLNALHGLINIHLKLKTVPLNYKTIELNKWVKPTIVKPNVVKSRTIEQVKPRASTRRAGLSIRHVPKRTPPQQFNAEDYIIEPKSETQLQQQTPPPPPQRKKVERVTLGIRKTTKPTVIYRIMEPQPVPVDTTTLL